jgi:hypothetical protein
MDPEDRQIFSLRMDEWILPILKVNSENNREFSPAKIDMMKKEVHRREDIARIENEKLEHSQSLQNQIHGARGNVLRLLIFGNAGGAIATLSFIGTIISKSDTATFDRMMFIVLIIFILGLIGGWAARTAEMVIFSYRLEKLRLNELEEKRRKRIDEDRWRKIFTRSFFFCFLMASLGFVMGLARLYQMTV